MRLSFFIVEQLDGEDAQGAAFMAKVKSQMNEAIKGTLYLPPFLRPNQCNIAADSVLFGCLDEVIGKGFAIFGQEDADYQYFLDADLEIQKTLTVDGATALKDKLDVTKKITGNDTIEASKDIQSTSGDVKAGSISLKTHTHPITAAQFTGTIDPVTGSAVGTISGNTQSPQ